MVLIGAAGQFGIFRHADPGHVARLQPERGRVHRDHRRHRRADLHLRQQHPGSAPARSITVCAYSYMSLVPIIQPPIIAPAHLQEGAADPHALQSAHDQPAHPHPFPIVVTLVVGILVPFATPLIGMLMLGNLMRESGAVERLTKASSQEIANIVTSSWGWPSAPPCRPSSSSRPPP